MTIRRIFSLRNPALFALAASLLVSCTVDEQANLTKGGAATGAAVKNGKLEQSAAEKKKEAAAKAKLAAAKAREEAERKAAEESEAKERAEKLALARRKEAEDKARAEALLSREKEREAAKAAKIAAKAKADADRQAREATREIEALASRGAGAGGFFSMLSIGTSARQYKSQGHEISVNHALLPALGPENAKIEVDLSEQRARVYRVNGPQKLLVIETQISSGKSGHGTPTGSYRIGEKLVQKQSSLYGTWLDGNGNAVGGSNEAAHRPAGASHFVGADMPYWMRINGGIGMHIGIVPDHPASHGCIRVPASVQPLIYSKVGVGTPVVITH